jgi:hypothetical protein
LDADKEVLDLIRQQVSADLAVVAEKKRQNDLAEQTLKIAADTELSRKVSERNRIKISLDTNEKASAIANELPRVFLSIYGIEESLIEIRNEIDRHFGRQNEILLIILTGRGNGNKARVNELIGELKLEGVQRLLSIEMQNLQELEETAAEYGSIDTPLRIVNAIRKTKIKIEDLERKINGLGDR